MYRSVNFEYKLNKNSSFFDKLTKTRVHKKYLKKYYNKRFLFYNLLKPKFTGIFLVNYSKRHKEIL
ncbi:hypothetical protein BpHYR1_020778 [Brachionus plicatilis]|uniref:Uncharacterized protein n=1 Tax=Brachionus plicatilis TaxID=10195 RepID=A0A3M7SG22_BRAPC|nr:hypothetical protein BpHYR1_020778 [Brachionus plicatilis]